MCPPSETQKGSVCFKPSLCQVSSEQKRPKNVRCRPFSRLLGHDFQMLSSTEVPNFQISLRLKPCLLNKIKPSSLPLVTQTQTYLPQFDLLLEPEQPWQSVQVLSLPSWPMTKCPLPTDKPFFPSPVSFPTCVPELRPRRRWGSRSAGMEDEVKQAR